MVASEHVTLEQWVTLSVRPLEIIRPRPSAPIVTDGFLAEASRVVIVFASGLGVDEGIGVGMGEGIGVGRGVGVASLSATAEHNDDSKSQTFLKSRLALSFSLKLS